MIFLSLVLTSIACQGMESILDITAHEIVPFFSNKDVATLRRASRTFDFLQLHLNSARLCHIQRLSHTVYAFVFGSKKIIFPSPSIVCKIYMEIFHGNIELKYPCPHDYEIIIGEMCGNIIEAQMMVLDNEEGTATAYSHASMTKFKLHRPCIFDLTTCSYGLIFSLNSKRIQNSVFNHLQ